MPLALADIAAASERWVWMPPGAPTVETDEYLLIRYPDWVDDPVQLLRLRPTRPIGEVIDEAVARVAELGDGRAATALFVPVPIAAPAGLEDELLARGAELAETVDVLGLDLATGAPELDAPSVELRPAVTPELVREVRRVGHAVFGGGIPAEDLAAHEADAADNAASLAAGRRAELLALVDGRPAGAAGVTVVDGDVRLWGAGVLPEFRGRGVYRALLAERIAFGIRNGGRLAIVQGRVETSGPILRRAGFIAAGQERTYRLPLE